MNVNLAVLADYANVTQEGKLNIMGTFDNIYADKFPCVHPEMKLVMQVEASISEVGHSHQIEVILMAADGARLFSVKGQVQVGEVKPGTLFKANNILNIRGLKFDQPGEFEFKILINGEERKSVPLKVLKIGNT